MGSRSGEGFPLGREGDRVRTARVARLATLRPDGRPHLVPITFAVADEVLVSAVDEKPKRTTELQRLRNIATCPAVAVLLDAYDEDWSRLWWVRLDGEADVVRDGDARAALLPPLVAKYQQYRGSPPRGPLVRIRVTRWTAWEWTAWESREPTLSVVARVYGRVQGVGFRAWTRRLLADLDLRGSAVNLADGTVEVTATGNHADLERLVRSLQGPGAPGSVTAVDVSWSEDLR